MKKQRILETWKDIEGFEGLYQVSDLGRVKSIDRKITRSDGVKTIYKGKILKPFMCNAGYKQVSLAKNGRTKKEMVHRLVVISFLPKINNKNHCNHKDGVKTNNKLSNLEWCSRSENTKHAYRLGLMKAPLNMLGKCGELHHLSKKVNQMDKHGAVLNSFGSIREAMRETGINHIGACCKGKYSSAGGFLWEYVQ